MRRHEFQAPLEKEGNNGVWGAMAGYSFTAMHQFSCDSSPGPQAPRPPLHVCLPHSARLTFLQPKCVYIYIYPLPPPGAPSPIPVIMYRRREWYGGSRFGGTYSKLPASNPNISTVVEVPSVILPLILACLKKMTLSRGIDLLAQA